MKITIITTTYNSEKTIRDTLQSVANQDYPDIEHIIIDGKSEDTTLEIVNSFPHVAKVISEKDNGIYDAMNKGWVAATGDVIAILNSDDFYTLDTAVSEMIHRMKEDKVDCIYADLDFVDAIDTDKIVRKWRSKPHYRRSSFLRGWMPPHPTFFAKKVLYEKYGGFRTELKSAADYELMLRFLYANNASCTYLPKVIIKMRMGGQSNISIQNRLQANKEDRLAWRYNGFSIPFWIPFIKPARKILQYF